MPYRPKVKEQIKRNLITECGGKCANPGCPNTILELHHIKEWAVYKTHDDKHMIAVCPTCHRACHFKHTLRIESQTVYKWKEISRPTDKIHGLLYVEPSVSPLLRCGTMGVTSTTPDCITIFEASENKSLGFRLLRNNELLLLNLMVRDLDNNLIIDVFENHTTFIKNDAVDYKNRPGKISLIAPLDPRYIPVKFFWDIISISPNFANKGFFPILDLEVLNQGELKVQGLWLENNCGLAITDNAMIFLRSDGGPVSLSESGQIIHSGEQALFKFSKES